MSLSKTYRTVGSRNRSVKWFPSEATRIETPVRANNGDLGVATLAARGRWLKAARDSPSLPVIRAGRPASRQGSIERNSIYETLESQTTACLVHADYGPGLVRLRQTVGHRRNCQHRRRRNQSG